MRQTPLPTGTVTFLFTDIEGSTRLWESQPDVMRPALARHDELLQQAIEANGGCVFKTVGDAFCAAFATAPEAVAAALDAQQCLSAEPWETDPPVRARMAVHTGAAQERGGDYFGQPLNRVARLLSAGHGGQILISAAAQELVRDALPSGCSLVDLGIASLKDLARPERVYQLEQAGIPSEFPPLRTLNSVELPNNLPQQPTSFIGREKELADIEALLGKSRLLTLVGAGGAGKTRLALQAAADLLDGDGDGVWLVELAPLVDPALVPASVAQALGVKEAAGEPIRKTLVDALKSKSLLIVLDNCEHVIHACASLVGDLLRHCPEAHVLATSREPLGVSGEQVYRIPSLSVPGYSAAGSRERSYTAAALTQYESVRLFIARAQAVQPSFTVTDANAPAVAQVCTHLDGIPLALELAAARVRSMPVEQVNARLDNRFRLLTGGARTTLPRQQTLRALIDWSYDLLTEQEKAMLRSLSVFAGGWTLDAAEAVCSELGGVGEGGLEDWEVLDLLTSLTDKSLVVYDEETETETESVGGAARYRMLETIRQYGQDRLEEGGESQSVQRRHRDWCLMLVEEAEPKLYGPETTVWLGRLQAEYDNLRAALLWNAQTAGVDSSGALVRLRIAANLARFWYVRGYYTEGRQWLGDALQQAGSADTEEALAVRARALSGAGILAAMQGDYAAARSSFQSALDIYRGIGDQSGAAKALSGLGNVASTEGNYDAALALLEESLRIKRQIQDRRGVAISLNGLGFMAGRKGDQDMAQAYFEESVELLRELGNEVALSNSLLGLGIVLDVKGEYADSLRLHQESLEIRRRVGDLQGVSDALSSLAQIANSQGKFASALEYVNECLEIRRRLGDQRGIALALSKQAAAVHGLGDAAAAASLLHESLDRARQVGDQSTTARTLLECGDLARLGGDLAAARLYLEECLQIERRTGNRRGAANALLSLGMLAVAENKPETARRCLQESLGEIARTGDKQAIADALDVAASVALLLQNPERAITLWSAAGTLRKRIGARLPAQIQEKLDAQFAAARADTAANASDAAARGQAMTLEQIAEYALSDS